MTEKVNSNLTDEVRATVHFVDLNRRGGPIAIASAPGVRGRIFLSLDGDVWKSHSVPQEGTWVMIRGLQRKSGRWIAESGRLYTLADDLPQSQHNEE